jgi:hypothetical protein
MKTSMKTSNQILSTLLTLTLIQHGQDVLPGLDSAKAEVLPGARQLLGGALLQAQQQQFAVECRRRAGAYQVSTGWRKCTQLLE